LSESGIVTTRDERNDLEEAVACL
jgi:hypothetical protein